MYPQLRSLPVITSGAAVWVRVAAPAPPRIYLPIMTQDAPIAAAVADRPRSLAGPAALADWRASGN